MSAEKKIVYAEDVLTAVCMYCDSHIEFCDTCPIKDAIMDAPDAEKRGEWVESRYKGYFVCSACKNCFIPTINYGDHYNKWKYCPNCGARLYRKENEDGQDK